MAFFMSAVRYGGGVYTSGATDVSEAYTAKESGQIEDVIRLRYQHLCWRLHGQLHLVCPACRRESQPADAFHYALCHGGLP